LLAWVGSFPNSRPVPKIFHQHDIYWRPLDLREEDALFVGRHGEARITRRRQTFYLSDFRSFICGKGQELNGRARTGLIDEIDTPVEQSPISPVLGRRSRKDSDLVLRQGEPERYLANANQRRRTCHRTTRMSQAHHAG
jgi:hypothetical protein